MSRETITNATADRFRYQRLMETFDTPAAPAFEDAGQQEKIWGAVWGADSEVGTLRTILVHRPGDEIKRVTEDWYDPELESYCNREEGIWWRGRNGPDLPAMQQAHDQFTSILRENGVEVAYIHENGQPTNRPVPIKQMSPRDIVIGVPGGAIVCRPNAKGRREESFWAARRVMEMGCPIIRTISGTGIVEGGSFMWIDAKTAALSTGLCANREGVEQVREVLAHVGVDLITVQVPGYGQHLDGFCSMIDTDKALINPTLLPYDFVQVLQERGIEPIALSPEDPPFAVNLVPLGPGRVIASEMSPRTRETLEARGVEVIQLDYEACWSSGGGLRCNSAPLARDSV
ncbi:MAG: arginine deiminase-related protein [Pseudomonadota bacterium]